MKIPDVLVRCLWMVSLLAVAPARADTTRVAVAANFATTFERLAALFHARTGHVALPSAASTGQLYAQIVAHAPFDVFLSADTARPRRLARQGLALPDTGFTYARGQLVLWHASADPVDEEALARVLVSGEAIAIADPRTAPYGAAAAAFLRERGLWDRLERNGQLAVAASITQAYQFVAAGAARLGFVALSQVLDLRSVGAASNYVRVPLAGATLDQRAILLIQGRENKAARALLMFLRTDSAARKEIERSGYELPQG